MNVARPRRWRRIPGVTALLSAVVLAVVAVAVIAGGVLLAGAQHVPERTASALVLTVTGCDRTNCSYGVSYLDAQGKFQSARIWASAGEASADSTATIYYQVAHPDVARFPDSDYPSDTGDPLAGFGVILFLGALVLAVVGLVRLVRGQRRARRAPAR
jgi:hypothetical protein